MDVNFAEVSNFFGCAPEVAISQWDQKWEQIPEEKKEGCRAVLNVLDTVNIILNINRWLGYEGRNDSLSHFYRVMKEQIKYCEEVMQCFGDREGALNMIENTAIWLNKRGMCGYENGELKEAIAVSSRAYKMLNNRVGGQENA